MHRRDGSSVLFGCFSPPVMFATFLFEIVSAIYVLWRYEFNLKAKLIISMLVNLSLFQLAEYFVCQQTSFAVASARFGYAAITLLPVLGIHLMGELTKPINKNVIRILYLIAGLIVLYFLAKPDAFNGYECTGNYVIFQIGQVQTYIYSFYYFGLLLAALLKGSRHIVNNKQNTKGAKWLMIGYLVFITPVAILTVLHPDTRRAVPSVLCGFAVSLAIILVARLAPMTLIKRLQ